MRKADLIDYYRRTDPDMPFAAIARAVGVTPQAFSQWEDVVPELTARRVQEMTKGKLRVQPDLYKRRQAS